MRAVTAVTDGLCHPVEGADSVDVVDAGLPFEEAYALADAAAGEGQWRACSARHKLEAGENGIGPYLYGVVGRDVAAVKAFVTQARLLPLTMFGHLNS
jgi:cytochrome c